MGGSSGAKLGSRARAPSRARGDSGQERRRSPELRQVTGRGKSPRRRVSQSQVGSRSPARGVAETRTLSQGEQENRAPEIPMEVRTVSVTAQEEAAPREPDGTRPAEPVGESGKDTEMAQCTVCGEPWRCEETCPCHPFAMVLGAGEGLLALSGQRKQSSPPAGETLGCPRRTWQVWKSAIVDMVSLHHSCIGRGR